MQESTRARKKIQARPRSICARGGAVLSIMAAVVALMMVGWGVGSAGAAADGDKPIEEIVVIAKRLTCEGRRVCIDRNNPWFRMVMRGIQIPSTLFGPQEGGGGAPPEEEEEDKDEDEDGFCWRDLTAMPGARVSGPFKEPRASGPHKGLDIAVPTGTSVYAARSGVVAEVREEEWQMPDKDDKSEEAQEIRDNATSTGNYIEIEYDDGHVGRYLHLKRNAVYVDEEQRVSAGDRIAESNETGDPIGGAHLHYDHHDEKDYVDPQEELSDCESE